MDSKKIFQLKAYQLICLLIAISFLSSCASSRKVARTNKIRTVVTTARSYTGVPYKYGGTTIMGMDCSGLLMRSFEPVGVYIPRTAKQQSKIGKLVTLDRIRPGDLVFFRAKKGWGKVTHAGLVTDVRGRDEIIFIHASSSRGVVESNLMSNYYQRIFVKARRIKF